MTDAWSSPGREAPLVTDIKECDVLGPLGRTQRKPCLPANPHELGLRPVKRASPRRTCPSSIDRGRQHGLEDPATEVTWCVAHIHRVDPAKAIVAKAIVVVEPESRQQIVIRFTATALPTDDVVLDDVAPRRSQPCQATWRGCRTDAAREWVRLCAIER